MIKQLTIAQKDELCRYLNNFITLHKQNRISQVLDWRTRYLTVVLEDIYQSHNASAVIRSCECFGVQDIHIIEQVYNFDVNPDIVVGASKWVSLHRYSHPGGNATEDCLLHLKENGYRIAAFTLRHDSIPIQNLDLSQKIALCFGTEELGLTDKAHTLADVSVRIPMVGFTQSFNISVTVALSLFALMERIHAGEYFWNLTEAEKLDLRLGWYQRIINRSEVIIKQFLQERQWILSEVNES